MQSFSNDNYGKFGSVKKGVAYWRWRHNKKVAKRKRYPKKKYPSDYWSAERKGNWARDMEEFSPWDFF